MKLVAMLPTHLQISKFNLCACFKIVCSLKCTRENASIIYATYKL